MIAPGRSIGAWDPGITSGTVRTAKNIIINAMKMMKTA
jgi:hypothetical protein